MTSKAYHLQELEIARNHDDPRHIMPPISAQQEKILDVGCGAGQTLIASQLPAGVTAVGVDLDLSALVLGRQMSKGIRFVCARGEALPFPSDYFDLVICRVAIPYMHVRTALSEMRRVLKVGGTLWAVLHPVSMTLGELTGNLSRLEVKGAVYRLYVLVNGVVSHITGREVRAPFGKQEYESFQTMRGMRRTLTRAGFEEVVFDKSKGFVVTAKKAR